LLGCYNIIKDEMSYKAGIVFLKYESQEEMDIKSTSINQLIRLEVKKSC